MKYLKAAILIIFMIAISYGSFVDIAKAEKVAKNHMQIRAEKEGIDFSKFRLRDRNIINDKYDGKLLFYVFRFEPSGYVAVSADDRLRPVLAFSLENKCRINPPENSMIQLVHQDMHNRFMALENNLPPEILARNESLWNSYLRLEPQFVLEYLALTEWGPFVKTEWNQSAPWDMFVPDDPVTGERTPTGCVIVAVAQILHYWELPYKLELDSTDSYYSETTDPPIWIDATTANMDTIDWNDSDDSFGPSDTTAARISWAVGVALDAEYADGGTVAHCDAGTFLSKFGFVWAEDYALGYPGMRNTIRDNMKNAKIAYMSFSGPDAGHAAVVDGYEESGAYHINMGWGGHEDGWYYVFDETPLYFDGITGMILNLTGQYHWDIANNMSDAVEIVPRPHLQKKINNILPLSDVDWYRFEACDDSTYYFTTSGVNDMYLEIYNESGEMIVRADTGGTEYNPRIYWYTDIDAAGTYYVKAGADSAIADVNYKLWYKRISGPERQFIEITRPNGGEQMVGGDRMGIIFSKGGDPYINFVKIEYCLEGRSGPWHTIIDSLMGTYYMWDVPMLDDAVYDYRHCYLKISDPVGGYAVDISDGSFRMVHPDAIYGDNQKPEAITLGASPNPFNSIVRVDHRNIDDVKIQIFDIDGTLIEKIVTDDKDHSLWNADGLSAGIYFARIIGIHEGENIDEIIKLVYMK